MKDRLKRTKLKDRILPIYTKAEELFNMTSHIVGGGIGVVILVLCVVFSVIHGNAWGLAGSIVYGVSVIGLYTMSSIYHGLNDGMPKRVFQVLDHCAIYFLIGGTYTPIILSSIRKVSPVWCWVIFGLVWGFAAMATVFTAIDLKKYSKLSMICYIGMGWCIVIAAKPTIEAIPLPGLIWLLAGGIAYSVGAVLYNIGKKKKFIHSVFHLFVLAGTILQFICIFFYVI